MILKGWIRESERTKINKISGKLSKREQDDFRRLDGQKGHYDFIYSHRYNETTIRLTEHPEWTGEFAKARRKKGARYA